MHDDDVLTAAVRSANGLTKRWMDTFDENQDVIGSGLGIWMVLSALLTGASGAARDELSEALALVQDEAAAVAQAVVALARDEDALHLATGLWTAPSISLLKGFVEACSFATVGEIPDMPALDAWALKHTNGMIKTFPVAPTAGTLMLLASAVAADLEWDQPFRSRVGSWPAGSELRVTLLRATTARLDKAAILDRGGESVIRFVCASTSSIDVHLVSGDSDASPGGVLSCAIRALTDESLVTPASQLEVGDSAGALSVRTVTGTQDHVRIDLPAFSMKQSHDLLENLGLWGLTAASDTSGGHFACLAEEPLAIEQGVQDARVDFDALGFKAAAVTVVRAVRSARREPREMCRRIHLNFDVPFGFVAVHRDTGLVLFSGWVATTAVLQPASEPDS